MSKEITDILKEKNIKTIEVIYADTGGSLAGKMVPTESFLKNYQNGFGVCKASFGWDIQGQLLEDIEIFDFKTGCPDVYIRPILATLQVIPWREGYAYVIGEIYEENGEPFTLAPRHILKNIVQRYNELHYRPIVGTELEFYLLDQNKQPLSGGIQCYSHRRALEVEDVLGEIRDRLEQIGVKIEATHVEYGPGQIEIVLEHGDALEIADKSLLTKTIVKDVAKKHGVYASFMAKPWAKESGSGLHIHQSIWNLDLSKNIFQVDQVVTKHYLAGLTATLSELMAFIAPTINSYKRFTVNSFAPTVASWGIDNRTTAIRSLLSDSSGSRLEQRIGSADSNPYLAIAASLAGGLFGIENEVELKEKAAQNAYTVKGKTLPKNLEEAIREIEKSSVAETYFGSEFIKIFAALGRNEINLYAAAVTDWEFNRYFEYS